MTSQVCYTVVHETLMNTCTRTMLNLKYLIIIIKCTCLRSLRFINQNFQLKYKLIDPWQH